MAYRHVPDYFEDEDLSARQAALESMVYLKTRDAEGIWDADDELKTSVSEKLMPLAPSRLIKPEERRSRDDVVALQRKAAAQP